MRPLRLIVSGVTTLAALVLLLFIILEPSEDADYDNPPHSGRINALYSFTSPGSLFPPSAIISLTDDNSTFFLARPAAFGPDLPKHGLSGPLWIGHGFGEEMSDGGELGCGDDPDWDEDQSLLRTSSRSTSPSTDDRPTTHSGYQGTGSDAEIPDMIGKVALLKRGGCGFLAKVMWAQRRGATAVIVGDNMRGGALIRMYARADTSNVTIPSLFTSHTTAHLLSSLMPPNSLTAFDGGQTSSLDVGEVENPGSEDITQSAAEHQSSPTEDMAELNTSARGTGILQDLNKVPGWLRTLLSSFLAKSEGQTKQPGDLSQVGPEHHKSERGKRSVMSITGTNLIVNPPSLEGRAHDGLWVTLTPTSVSASPFFDTLLVLVVSPLVTLTVVYALLLLRSRIRRRRWRAPKSVVERLPVRTYQTISDVSSSATPDASSPTTPLLSRSTVQAPAGESIPESASQATVPIPSSSTDPKTHEREEEKRESGLAAWRRRYGGRQRECVVCLEEYEDGVSQVMSLPCGHEFHADCMYVFHRFFGFLC